MNLLNLATLFRAAQFYAQIAHQTASGPGFYTDHKVFGDYYDAYAADYDAIVERMIGLGESPDLFKLQKQAAAMIAESSSDRTPKQFYGCLLATENELQDCIKKCCKGCSDGTANLLQDMADRSEMRIYQLKQRLA